MISSKNINLIQVNTANCFEVELKTGSQNKIEITADIEGEYVSDLNLKAVTAGATLLVEAGFSPNFQNPNDKLSAHKVVSIILYITVPNYSNVDLYGTNSNVFVNGEFSKMSVALSDGACELINVLGSVFVRTQSGAIKVFSNAADIKTKSKYGNIDFNKIPFGPSKYQLETVTGNIELSKTE